ncbi:MAG: alpha/beta hydrolase [Anaerolineales bacterium]
MADGFLDLNGASLRYEASGKGTPVVLVHAGIANMAMWQPQFEALADSLRMIRFDLRGWGESPCPPGEYRDVDDLAAILDALGIKRAVIVGCSFGGSTAIDFALTYPERVLGLLLSGPGLRGFQAEDDEATADLGRKVRVAYDAGDLAHAAELTAQLWVDGQGRTNNEVDPGFRSKALAMIAHTYTLPDDEGKRQSVEPPAAERLGELQVPVWVVVGEYDVPAISMIADEIVAGVEGARLVPFAGAAHLPSMEQPGVFNDLLLRFVETMMSTGPLH